LRIYPSHHPLMYNHVGNILETRETNSIIIIFLVERHLSPLALTRYSHQSPFGTRTILYSIRNKLFILYSFYDLFCIRPLWKLYSCFLSEWSRVCTHEANDSFRDGYDVADRPAIVLFAHRARPSEKKKQFVQEKRATRGKLLQLV